MASTRVIAQSGVADKLISQVKEIVGSLRAGDVQNDKGVSLGALFSEASANNAVRVVKDALANGAELILGDVSNQKAVVQPHLLKNVKPGTTLWDRETFAPGEKAAGVILCSVIDIDTLTIFIDFSPFLCRRGHRR